RFTLRRRQAGSIKTRPCSACAGSKGGNVTVTGCSDRPRLCGKHDLSAGEAYRCFIPSRTCCRTVSEGRCWCHHVAAGCKFCEYEGGCCKSPESTVMYPAGAVIGV